MGSAADELRVVFLPFMTPGHMIPLLDMAKLFFRRRVSVTIITTPGNEHLVRPTIDRANATASPGAPLMDLLLLPFPSSVSHLMPQGGGENLSSISSSEFGAFVTATFALHQPLHDLLRGRSFDCLVSDSIFAWTADIALDLGVPRLIFNGPGAFLLCVHSSIELRATHKAVANDSETFVVEGLPHRIEMTRSELSEAFDTDFMLNFLRQGEEKSYGIVVNTFYELEPAYAELYRREQRRKVWYVGPVSLCNEGGADKAERGGRSGGGWLPWLDSQAAGSVVYVCFGSLCEVSTDQLRETALGLEASGHPFIWVVKDGSGKAAAAEWLPEGFEARVGGKGLVIRGWAPQILILNHPAVGGFVTHCGWNSTLEGVAAGVPMATWPLSYDQFVNEKFITQVARIGVRIRSGDVLRDRSVMVKREEVAGAVAVLMDAGELAEGIRQRAREFAAMARAAMGDGGSSCADMDRLIEELREKRRRGGGEEAAEGVAL